MGKMEPEGLIEFLKENSETFFEKYLANLSDEELTRFLDTNPDFLDELEMK